MTILSWMGEHWFLSLVFGTFAFTLLYAVISGFFGVLNGLVNRGRREEPEEEEEEEQETEPEAVTTEPETTAQPAKPAKRRSLWERLNDDA